MSCTAWALLSMLYDDPQSLSDPSKERATHARNARHRAMQLAQTDGHTGEDPQADGFVELASLLASMHASGDLIGAVCRAALAAQPALAGTPEVVLSQARAAIQAEDGLTAADLCRQVIQSSGARSRGGAAATVWPALASLFCSRLRQNLMHQRAPNVP